jgi:hypothetical protein
MALSALGGIINELLYRRSENLNNAVSAAASASLSKYQWRLKRVEITSLSY